MVGQFLVRLPRVICKRVFLLFCGGHVGVFSCPPVEIFAGVAQRCPSWGVAVGRLPLCEPACVQRCNADEQS